MFILYDCVVLLMQHLKYCMYDCSILVSILRIKRRILDAAE